jgi:hypothetical protein
VRNDIANNNNNIVVPFEYCEKSNDSTPSTEHEHDNMHELAITDDGHVDWAIGMEEAINLSIQGEHMPARYSPTSASPCLTPWYPPPLALDYACPWTHFAGYMSQIAVVILYWAI